MNHKQNDTKYSHKNQNKIKGVNTHSRSQKRFRIQIDYDVVYNILIV